MADDIEDQEKTEDPSEHKKQKARKQGQVARSKELNNLITASFAIIAFFIFGKHITNCMQNLFYKSFTIERSEIYDSIKMMNKFVELFWTGFKAIIPFLLLILVATIILPFAVGGINFTLNAIEPKLERLNIINGIKKMFSVKTLVELIKGILKFSLVALTFIFVAKLKILEVFNLDKLYLFAAMAKSMDHLLVAFLAMMLPLSLIAAIDIPFQIWNLNKQLRMTKQEMKDEFKEMEGKPEVKSKIKKLQTELRKRRMMSNVPKADVVITNPTHFAVAIKYDKDNSMAAPIVVAKGADLISEMIKKVASAHEVPIVSVPELARSIYYTVEIEEEIPTALYIAVAKVLAYVFELKLYKQGLTKEPILPNDYPIPEEFRH